MRLTLSRRAMIGVITAAVVVVLAITGLVIAAVNSATSTSPPEGSTASSTPPSSSPAPSVTPGVPTPVPTTIPDLSTLKLTAEGWMPVPVTTDPRLFGAATAAALWSYNTAHTTRESTLTHFEKFGQPTAAYVGVGEDGARALLLYKNADAQIKQESDFEQLQVESTKVTATVVAVKSDAQLSTWPNEIPLVVYGRQQNGVHIVTTTLEVHFSSPHGSSAGDDTQRVIISVQVQCEPGGGICGAALVESTPIL